MSSENDSSKIISREFEEVTIPMPWGHIAGCWYGEKNVRPILALHGWLDNYKTWDNLIPLMPPHIGVLAIDMAGHGKSSHRPDGELYHGMSYLADIVRIMQHYKWNKVSIMAHSMSTSVAFAFAGFYPDRIDMLIQLDGVVTELYPIDYIINRTNFVVDKFLLEEKRRRESQISEPPSYSMDELIQKIHEGSRNSVDIDKCMHLIPRNVTKSKLYPSKYYFSRDPRVKYYLGFTYGIEFIASLADRIKIPLLLIKASKSDAIDVNNPFIEILRKNNPYFEFHIIEGTHHFHLNNGPETSVIVNKFINKWKPRCDADTQVQQICPSKAPEVKSKL